jgi:hypothetical protein
MLSPPPSPSPSFVTEMMRHEDEDEEEMEDEEVKFEPGEVKVKKEEQEKDEPSQPPTMQDIENVIKRKPLGMGQKAHTMLKIIWAEKEKLQREKDALLEGYDALRKNNVKKMKKVKKMTTTTGQPQKSIRDEHRAQSIQFRDGIHQYFYNFSIFFLSFF